MFIEAPDYGTRASSVVLVDRNGDVTFVEQTTASGNDSRPPVTYSFSGAIQAE